jgi:hypothetical protein
MKKTLLVSLLVLGSLLVTAAPSSASHGGRVRVFVGIGPGYWWWGPPYPYGWYPPPYYVYPPAPIIIEPPPVYVEPPPPPPVAYWYYCSSAQAYYPTVPTCLEPWIKVPERRE